MNLRHWTAALWLAALLTLIGFAVQAGLFSLHLLKYL